MRTLLTLFMAVVSFSTASAGWKDMQPGGHWTLYIDDYQFVMKIGKERKQEKYAQLFEAYVDGKTGYIGYQKDSPYLKFHFFIKAGVPGHADCDGESPHSVTFVSGRCSDGRVFAMTPRQMRVQNTQGNQTRNNRAAGPSFNETATRTAREVPNKPQQSRGQHDKGNVESLEFFTGNADLWISEFVREQRNSIIELFGWSGIDSVYETLSDDCRNSKKCQAVTLHRTLRNYLAEIKDSQ